MRAKPDMKPWVHTDKSILSSEGAALSARTSEFIRSVVPPLKGLNKYTITNNPGLAPWAMKSVALAGLIDIFTTNQLLGCLDALAPWAMQECRPFRAHLLMS